MLRRSSVIVCLVSLALAAASGPLAAQAWKGKGRLQGIVTDEQDKPVVHAKITLHPMDDPESGPKPLYTDKKGRWSILGLRQGSWRVIIEAEGFTISDGVAHVSEFHAVAPVRIALKKSPTASIGVGDRLLEEGKYAEARAAYEEALPHLEPLQQARLRSRIADTFFEEGKYGDAETVYKQTLAELPPEERLHVLLQLGESYRREGNYSAAREQYEATLPLLGPVEQARVLLTVANTFGVEGNQDQAIATIERALALDPDNAPALQLIADLLTQAGRGDEADQYLDRIPEDADLPPDLLLNVGIRLYNENDLDGALKNFNRVVQRSPDYPDSYYFRGLVYLARQENDLAAADLEKFLELAPDHAKAAEAREFLTYLKPQ